MICEIASPPASAANDIFLLLSQNVRITIFKLYKR